jgi:hypothetical protein
MSTKLIIPIAIAFVLIPRVSQAQTDSALPTARYRDGTYSYSTSRPGTCAGHGGVSEWLATSAATAKCNDGTLSASASRQGACSRHGGVAEWFGTGNEQDYVAAMKSDLRNLVTAEEVFFADSVRYTTKIGRGGLTFSATAGNELPNITLTADGWFATIRNANTQTRCMIFIGSTASPPARKEGVPVCTQP